jgi:eukaryotic-like serine/threonine-protein kinase
MDPVHDGRFELVHELGEGTFGTVFLARDVETGEHVAVKKLQRLDENSVRRFKREFRALADIHHPNLVKLYDLQRGHDAWFITMEYVRGDHFGRHFGLEAGLSLTLSRPANGNDPSHMLQLFHDLACGVNALHSAGLLHRDLKPSNVLLSDVGRVVVLDFGLVRAIEGASQLTFDGAGVGTPAYMAPEQCLGETLREASDWYAYGAMLYEAICGDLPFTGTDSFELMENKVSQDAPSLKSGAPAAVLELCTALLSRSPEQRPHGARVLEVMAAASGRSQTAAVELSATVRPAPTMAAPELFGRNAELDQLRAAYAEVAQHGSLVVHVRGSSGSGKSSLLERFLAEAPSGVILRSRCYEREAMPFKALDGVLDGLVSYLSQLSDVACAHLLPKDIAALVGIFPVLGRLRVLKQLHDTRSEDEAQHRSRAQRALRELISNVASQQRVLIWIDDLQWGDLDIASVLRDWLEEPFEAPVLIVLSYRGEELGSSPCLTTLFARGAPAGQRVIELAALRAQDVRELCMRRLTRADMIERIVDEARGHAFLVQQLAVIAEAKQLQDDSSLDGLSVLGLVERACAYLGEPARALLHVLAVAGRPLSMQLAASVAQVTGSGRAQIHALRGLRLLRTRDAQNQALLECYHERVREAVLVGLSPEENVRLHARLYRELVSHTSQVSSDHDWLHALALGAGLRAQAFEHGLRAAEHASPQRAAELYRSCLSTLQGELPVHTLWLKLAAAEVRCRRGHTAASAYRHAAEHAPRDERRACLQLAASHLLRSGRFEPLLTAESWQVPQREMGVRALLSWERARLALRSLAVPASASQPAEREAWQYAMLTLDAQLHAPLHASLFQARALRLALAHAQPRTAARVLCIAAASAAMSGAAGAQAMLQRAEDSVHGDVPVELLWSRAICAQLLGQHAAACECAAGAEHVIERQHNTDPHGDYYYWFTVRTVRITALQCLGRLLEARQLLHEQLAFAHATDNRATALTVSVNRVIDEQAIDMCAATRVRLDAEYDLLPKEQLSPLLVAHRLAVMHAGCANRDFDWALARSAELWPRYLHARSQLGTFLAVQLHSAHARLLLNHHVETRSAHAVHTLVREDIAQLQRLPSSPARDLTVRRIESRIALLRGDRAAATQNLREVTKQPATGPDSARDQYALGLLLLQADAEAAQLIATARAALADFGISDPDADMRAYVPELL